MGIGNPATRPGRSDLTTHGAFTAATRKRYGDCRTQEGQRLRAVREALVESVGGPEGMTPAQGLILAGMEAKLIVTWEISDYVGRQESIIDPKTSELLACLNRNFIAYSESLRRDLITFYGLNRHQIRRERLPKLEDLIQASRDGAE
jgi:hypothetical protein